MEATEPLIARPVEGDVLPFAARAAMDLYEQARAGILPAEALPRYLRWQLVADLHSFGMTDAEIASQTAQTTYTTARIRDYLRLLPNRPRAEELSA